MVKHIAGWELYLKVCRYIHGFYNDFYLKHTNDNFKWMTGHWPVIIEATYLEDKYLCNIFDISLDVSLAEDGGYYLFSFHSLLNIDMKEDKWQSCQCVKLKMSPQHSDLNNSVRILMKMTNSYLTKSSHYIITFSRRFWITFSLCYEIYNRLDKRYKINRRSTKIWNNYKFISH